jgi:TolA-binding protein
MQVLETPDSKDMDANPEAAAEQNTVSSAIMPISTYKEDKPNIMAFINLVLGVVIGIAVMAILIIPSIKHKEATGGDTNYSDNASLVSQVHDKENTIKTLQSDKDKLNEELKKLQTQIDSTASQEDITTVYETLDAAVGQYLTELAKPASQRDYSALADTLAGIDDSKFKSDSSLSLIKTLRDIAYPEAAKLHYDKGHNLYSKAKYEEALTELEKAMTFDPKDADAVYFTARSYDRMGDKQNAATYYNKVINDFSDSSRVTDAKSFLKQVQGQ